MCSTNTSCARPGAKPCRRACAPPGVGTGIHYPMPVHLQPAYADRVALGPAGCAATATASAEVLSLPIYPELTDAQVEQVCGALRDLAE